MTLLEGIKAASAALGFLKELNEIDRSVNEADFKLKIADITTALADAKIALSDAQIEIEERERTIGQLQRQLDEAFHGETCPKCGIGRMAIDGVEPANGKLGEYGVEKWQYACEADGCGFRRAQLHDPHYVIPELARKPSE